MVRGKWPLDAVRRSLHWPRDLARLRARPAYPPTLCLATVAWQGQVGYKSLASQTAPSCVRAKVGSTAWDLSPHCSQRPNTAQSQPFRSSESLVGTTPVNSARNLTSRDILATRSCSFEEDGTSVGHPHTFTGGGSDPRWAFRFGARGALGQAR